MLAKKERRRKYSPTMTAISERTLWIGFGIGACLIALFTVAAVAYESRVPPMDRGQKHDLSSLVLQRQSQIEQVRLGNINSAFLTSESGHVANR